MRETLLNHFENDPSILDDIWFSDEAVFYSSGGVNRQNTQIWETQNPKFIQEKEHNSPKLVLCCAISAKGIISPYVFRDDQRKTTTANLKMLENFILSKLRNNAVVEHCYFQQDKALAHYTTDYLNQLFYDNWIWCRGPLEWATCSSDLTPCDFFLMGFLKSQVYSTRPQNLEELEQRIRA